MTQAFLGPGRTTLHTMSSGRSRHSTSRTSHYQSRGTKNRAPRYKPEVTPRAMDNDLDDAHMSHFSLSSNSISGTARSYNVSNWLYSDNSYSPDDDYPVLGRPIPGQTATSTADAMLDQPAILSTGEFEMASSYGSMPASLYPRHAPLDQLSHGTMQFSSLSISPESMHVTAVPTDLGEFPTSFGDISQLYRDSSSLVQPDSWTYGYPSPPLSDDVLYTSEFSMSASVTGMSSVPHRHDPVSQRSHETTVCEPLGPSPIQPYW